MPQVPVYGDPKVHQAPLPNARVTNDAPIEAFGGGKAVERLTDATKSVVGVAHEIFQEEKAKADQTRLLESRKAMNDWEQANIHDPKTGARSKLGKDAFAVPDELSQSFDKFVGEQSSDLSNPEQRQAFSQMAEGRRESINSWANNHVAEQQKVYEDGEFNASLESSKERGSVDPRNAPTEQGFMVQQIRQRAAQQGWPTEVTKQAIQKNVSDMHYRAVTGLLSAGKDSAAQAYFDQIAGTPKGLSVPGNIDLTNRPRVQNADGSVSTVRSMSFNVDGKEVLVPTVSDDGRILSNKEAMDQYKATGKQLGIFDDVASANAYAEKLHNDQADMVAGKTKIGLDPDVKTKLQAALETQTLRGASQKKADEIVGSSKGMSDALEKVRAITDPKLRDETDQRVSHAYAQMKQEKQDNEEKLYLAATNIVDQTKSFDRIPPTLINALPLEKRASLQRYAEQKALGKNPPALSEDYYNLRTMAVTPGLRDKFLSTNLLEYKDKVAHQELEGLIDMQTGARKGDPKAEKALDGIQSDTQIVNSAITDVLGLKTSPKPGTPAAATVREFRRKIDIEASAFKEQTGKKYVPNEDLQKIVDRLTVKHVTEQHWYWDTTKFAFQVPQGTKAPAIVPAAERAKITEALKRRGIAPTEAAITTLFNRSQGN